MDDYEPPDLLYGLDFSADRRRAGQKIWIAECQAGDPPRVTDCRPAAALLDVSSARESVVPAVTRMLGSLDGDAAAGLDFPFALPEPVVAADDWPAFLRALPSWADDPSDLARECEHRAETAGESGELRRATEDPLDALSPYNRRLRHQTFYGIRDLLRPLVLSGSVRAAPMQPPDADRPTLLEVYPGGTLERLEAHDARYKDDTEDARNRRAENLDALADAGLTVDSTAREAALEDDDGDALDAVVAAFAAYQHTRDPGDLWTNDETRLLEGHIYV
jgi:hypothetical protein